MTIEISRDGFFYPYAVPIADAYMSSVPKNSTKLWLRSDVGLSVGEDLLVSSWSDVLSGTTNIFSQGTVLSRPFLNINAVNGKHSINFPGLRSGVIKRLVEESPFIVRNMSPMHFFIVLRMNSVSTSASFGIQKSFFGNTSTTSGSIKAFAVNANTLNVYYQSGGSGTLGATNPITLGQWYILEFKMINSALGNSELFINGNIEASGPVPFTTTNSAFMISATRGTTETTSQGDYEVAEIICINQLLSDPTNIRNYLSLRYNIPLVFP